MPRPAKLPRIARPVWPEGVQETVDAVAQLPIRTRTMARLLAQQGKRDLALQIYAELCAAAPHDAELKAEAARAAQPTTPE